MVRHDGGFVLVMVMVLLVAGAMLAAAVAASAAIETAMAGQSVETAAAFSAAEAGVATALRSGGWSAGPWTDTGTLPGGAAWEAAVTLAAAAIAGDGTTPEWHFEVVSTGSAGRATTTLVQGFVVRGALPGEPVLTYWRQEGPAP